MSPIPTGSRGSARTTATAADLAVQQDPWGVKDDLTALPTDLPLGKSGVTSATPNVSLDFDGAVGEDPQTRRGMPAELIATQENDLPLDLCFLFYHQIEVPNNDEP